MRQEVKKKVEKYVKMKITKKKSCTAIIILDKTAACFHNDRLKVYIRGRGSTLGAIEISVEMRRIVIRHACVRSVPDLTRRKRLSRDDRWGAHLA